MPRPIRRSQMRLTRVRARRPSRGSRKRGGGGGAAVGQRIGGGRVVQFGVQEGGFGVLILGHVAAVKLQLRLGREVGGERIGVLQLPVADKAVVAGIALEIDAEEDLRGVLGGLDGGCLAGADRAAPVDADQEAFGIGGGGRIQELFNEPVVGQVGFERAEQPGRDGLAGGGFGVVVDAFVVAQEVVPEGDPVFGVFSVVREQSLDELAAFVGRLVFRGMPGVGRVGEQALDVERDPAGEDSI